MNKKINTDYCKLFSLVCLLLFQSNIYSQENKPWVIEVVNPKIKIAESIFGIEKSIKSKILSCLINFNDVIKIVDRDLLDQINYRRGTLKNSDVEAASMYGANYLLETKISDINLRVDSFFSTKIIDAKEIHVTLYTASVSYNVDLQMVEVETGIAAFSKRIKSTGWSYIKLENNKIDFEKLKRDAMEDSYSCFYNTINYTQLEFIQPKVKVIHISQSDQKEVEKIIIQGGNYSYKNNSIEFDILIESESTIENKKVFKYSKIGEAKLIENTFYTNELKVTKGGNELKMGMDKKSNFYVKANPLSSTETCEMFLEPKNRTMSRTTFEKLRQSDSNSVIKLNPDNKETKRIQNKTVPRKN